MTHYFQVQPIMSKSCFFFLSLLHQELFGEIQKAISTMFGKLLKVKSDLYPI